MARRLGNEVCERRGPFFRQEDRFDGRPGRPQKKAQHDFAFGDETILAADEVALPHRVICFDPGIG